MWITSINKPTYVPTQWTISTSNLGKIFTTFQWDNPNLSTYTTLKWLPDFSKNDQDTGESTRRFQR